MKYLFWFIIIFSSLILGFLFFLYSRIKNKERLLTGLNTMLFLIIMPKYDFKNEKMIEKEEESLIGKTEQIYSFFLELKHPSFLKKLFCGPPTITFEIASQLGGTDISFYVAIPRSLESAFERYVQGIYPRALVEKVPNDYTIFEPGGKTVGCYLKLKNPAYFPISTYKNLEQDPLASVTNALSKIKPDEGAALQIIIRPLPQDRWKNSGDKVLSKIMEGKPVWTAINEASRNAFADFFIELINLLTGRADKDKRQGLENLQDKKIIVDERAVQAIQIKTQKQAFEANIRILASAQTQKRAEEIIMPLEGVFGQFSLNAMNSFKAHRLKKGSIKKLVYDFSFRNFNPKQSNILNTEELTSIYHFPTHYIETPYIRTAKSGVAAPPIELPDKGLTLIGKTDFRGEEKNINFISREDRRRHFYIIGQTGTGKTSLLREMIRQDIENNEGIAVIDPHGELIEDTLANIPKHRIEDVVLFEPFDTERPMGLNMLEYETPEQKDFAVQEMIAIFHKLFPPEIIGPMFEHYMRNAMLAIMADIKDPGTLVDIPRMFTDEEFLENRLKKVTDPIVKNFWVKEWRQTTGVTRSDMLGYVVSKVGRFIENEMMRNIIGQPCCAFNLDRIMQQGKIFLANLSKGMTGEVNSSLLGLILVSKMQMAAMRRAQVSEKERKDFYLYIDEFQNFTTDSVATILSEARKYRLNLILAHQYIPQLTQEIRSAVLGNVGTVGAFRVGADDAEFLEKQFAPEFSRFDLVNLDNFNFILKMMIENKISSPFRVQTVVPKKGNSKIVAPIKKLSRLKYGRAKQMVEEDIIKRSKITLE